MNALNLFLETFWPYFTVGLLMFSLVKWGKRYSLASSAPIFAASGSFKELSGFPESDRKRFLDLADRRAFPGLRMFIPSILWAFLFAFCPAFVIAVKEVTGSRFNTSWVLLGVSGCSFAAFIVAQRWEAGRIRPYLRECIQSRTGAA